MESIVHSSYVIRRVWSNSVPKSPSNRHLLAGYFLFLPIRVESSSPSWLDAVYFSLNFSDGGLSAHGVVRPAWSLLVENQIEKGMQ
jgi:hypothetical protein